MANWELKELGMRQFGYPPKTALKIKLLTSVMMVFATGTYNIEAT